jgi:hypothetical protein
MCGRRERCAGRTLASLATAMGHANDLGEPTLRVKVLEAQGEPEVPD